MSTFDSFITHFVMFAVSIIPSSPLSQMAGVTREKCLSIIEKYEPSAEGREMGHLGIDGEWKSGGRGGGGNHSLYTHIK